MMAEDSNYAGDLNGVPCVCATSMAVGVCRDGQSVGVDLIDQDGKTIAHGHLDLETAIEFHQRYGETIMLLADLEQSRQSAH